MLIAAVLLQAGQGGGMAASFGGVSSSASSFIGTRQAGNLLTKASWWCGGLFLGLSFMLALASTRSRAPKSVLDQTFSHAAGNRAGAPPAGGANPRDSVDASARRNGPGDDRSATGRQATTGAEADDRRRPRSHNAT